MCSQRIPQFKTSIISIADMIHATIEESP
jgi:hypothetical protein